MSNTDQKKILRDLAAGLLQEGRSIRLEASGYSMYPAIKPGNIIHIEAIADPGKLAPGQVIAWKRDNDLVVHRIIKIMESPGLSSSDLLIQTRGDSSPAPDKPVSFTDIAGKVVQVEDGPVFIPPAAKTLSETRYRINRTRVWCLILIKKLAKKLNLTP
jgi:signal peptidase I